MKYNLNLNDRTFNAIINGTKKLEKSERVMIGSGEHSCSVKSGLTPEAEREELDDRLDEVFYSKPVAFVKKLIRRINN